jgi:hypothetical protein
MQHINSCKYILDWFIYLFSISFSNKFLIKAILLKFLSIQIGIMLKVLKIKL